MTATFDVQSTQRVMECPHCVGIFSISGKFYLTCQTEGGFWYCPYCQRGRGWQKGTKQTTLEAAQAETVRQTRQECSPAT